MAYVYKEFPKWVTHPLSGEQRIVATVEDERDFIESPIPVPDREDSATKTPASSGKARK